MTATLAARCNRTPIFGGPRIGPSVESGAYQIAINGDEAKFRAHVQVATWADAVHRASQVVAAAVAQP